MAKFAYALLALICFGPIAVCHGADPAPTPPQPATVTYRFKPRFVGYQPSKLSSDTSKSLVAVFRIDDETVPAEYFAVRLQPDDPRACTVGHQMQLDQTLELDNGHLTVVATQPPRESVMSEDEHARPDRWTAGIPWGKTSLELDDFTNLQRFAELLNRPTDPFSRYLRSQTGRIAPHLLWKYRHHPNDIWGMGTMLVNKLNELIDGPCLHESDRFASITWRPRTRELLATNPTGDTLKQLNRLLLEDAYPNLIRRNRSLMGELQLKATGQWPNTVKGKPVPKIFRVHPTSVTSYMLPLRLCKVGYIVNFQDPDVPADFMRIEVLCESAERVKQMLDTKGELVICATVIKGRELMGRILAPPSE
jgi:hypothetical protein